MESLIGGWLLLLLTLGYANQSQGTKYNVSLAEMGTCKQYDLSMSGYVYSRFFHLMSMDNKKLGPNEQLHLKFYVLTAMDAHILMSETDHPRSSDKVYEIVIGAGGNTFSAIRTSMGKRRVATNQDPRLLSIFDPTPIEIVQLKDGNLSVYIPGFRKTPLLSYIDPTPLNVSFVSFSTFGAISAKWFYDCTFDGFGSEMEEEEFALTPQQQLIGNITAKAANRTVPYSLQFVNFSFDIHAVSYHQEKSVMKTRMHLNLYWNDTDLQWDPADFDGIKTLVRPDMDIWTPNIVVLNGAFETLQNFQPDHEIRIHSNGSVVLLASNAELISWCANGAKNWPNDRVFCELALGLSDLIADSDEQLELRYDNSAPLTQERVNMLSEWQFVQITVSRIVHTWGGHLLQMQDSDVIIDFQIVRNSHFYKNVFTMPVLASQTLLILSFLLRGYRRGALLLVVFVLLALGLMFITKHAPKSYIPNIMLVYQHLLRITTFCYILHIALMWLEMFPPKDKPYTWILSCISGSALRLILCLGLTNSEKYVDIQEQPWREISKILNAVSFLVIIGIFIAINSCILPTSA